MKNTKIFTLALVLLTMMGMATGCKGGKGKPEERMNWMVEKVTSKLSLDKDQEAKLRDLAQAVQEQHRALANEQKTQKEEFKAMILSDKLDKAKARALFDKKQSAMREGFDPIFEKLQVFHASLTSEQKKEAVKYLEKFQKRFH